MVATMGTRRIDWIVVLTALAFAVGCSGGGCGGCAGMEPIPGGFVPAKRNANAVQLRISDAALAKISADPAAIIGPLVGGAMNGVIDFNVPASCGGGTEICCVNGQPAATCGPISIDLVKRTNDAPRLALTPVNGASRMDMTIRARVKTKMDMKIKTQGITCDINLDTNRGSSQDLTITAQLNFPQDGTVGTTRVNAQNVSISLQDEDIQLNGNIVCLGASFFIGFVKGLIQDQIAGQVEDAINGATCKACESGSVAECGSSFATACTDKTCMVGNACMQELGLDGRMRAGAVLSGLSPGTQGAIDLYEVLGGYANTDSNGLAFGMLGGMEPGGAPRDRCGPPGTAPVKTAITPSIFFQGNTRPDTGAAFDVAIGLHKWQLDQFAYAAYDGGFLCLTLTGNTISQLSTDTFSLISRSLGNLVEGNSPMAVGLRPQSPPTITLGKNTFTADSMGNPIVNDPLLNLEFKAMEIDFFAAVNDQYVRTFTVVADVKLPVGLQVTGMGELQPVLGEIDDAFTNISVKNAEAITESPEQLASLFPTLLAVALPQLSGGLSPIALPELGGLKLAVTAVTATPQNVGGTDNSYLSIFANLAPLSIQPPVETLVSLNDVTRGDPALQRSPKLWRKDNAPSVKLSFGDTEGLEYSWRIDNGTWSLWSKNKTPTIRSKVFWLPAIHTIDVRARAINAPETIDETPARLEIDLRTNVKPHVAPFHGQPGEAGCNCQTTSAASASPLLLVFAFLFIGRRTRRRLRKAIRRNWLIVLVAIALLPGCNCGGSNKCGSVDCEPGEVLRGSLGHWTSIAADDKRVLVATYDQGLGDLVVIDVTDPAKQKFYAVDGVPDVDAVYEGDYRGGIDEPGENVGAFTSIAISRGHAMVAYQDRDNGTLKFAYEKKPGSWATMVVDDGPNSGQYASLIVDKQGLPAIAYVKSGLDDGMQHRQAELRVVRATNKDPGSEDSWRTSPASVTTGIATCGGLCGAGEVCIAGMMGETCAAVTSDCSSACGSGEACVAGACTEEIKEATVANIGTGTGLFAQLLEMPDGRLAVVYYNYSKRALEIAVENGAGAGAYTVTKLDGETNGDRGMWARAGVDPAGTVHIAYVDALGDQLMYTTFAGAPGTPEVVDDGQRNGERTHPVGAGATLIVNGGSPMIGYQDGMNADVYVATKAGAWSTRVLAQGPLLDGFWVSGTLFKGAPVMAWGSLDPAATPLGTIAVQNP
jgi:MYXO-CTERM domain-containing protein